MGAILGRPSVLGAVYLLALTAWASAAPIVSANDRALGAQAQEVSTFVATRFAGEIHRIALAIAACAIAVGAVLGVLAGLLVQARQAACGRAPLRGTRRAVRTVATLAVLHAWLVLHAMARTPELYAPSFYARGGLRRTVEVLVTDTLGTGGVNALGVVLLVAFFAGPPSAWRLWPLRFASLFRRARGVLWGTSRTAAAAAAILVGLAAGLPAVRPARAAASHPSRPNVVILAADSLRADRLTPAIMPHLSAFAARGTRFDRAYVSLPRTFPSWVTILTGRHAHHHGIRTMFPRWEDRAKDFDAVPERLARAGYATGVVSDYAGDIFSRINLGFGYVDTPSFDFRQLIRQRALERQTPLLPVLHSRLGRDAFPVLREMNVAADPQMLAADAERAIDRLQDRPFFLTVFFSTAHFPYAAPAPYYTRFTDPAYRGPFKYDKPVGLGGDDEVTPRDVRQVRALYDGAAAAIDDAAARVLAKLERDGLADDTIVLVTADHGETLFDHGHGQGHGDHLFGDEGTHVPLVIVDPRHRTPERDARIVRDVDIAPTLYALTGVAAPKDLDGVSLAPALDGKPTPPSLAYAETELWMGDVPALPESLRLPYPGVARLTELDPEHGDEIVLRRDMEPITTVARHRMVRDERYKLLYVPTRARVVTMLFDTVADPGEVHDIAAQHPDVVARLRGELWRWMLQDPKMAERDGYLLPRDVASLAELSAPDGAMRIDAPPPATGASRGGGARP